MNRRNFIKAGAALLTAGYAIVSSPMRAFAAWNESAFRNENFEGAIEAFYGTKEHTASDKVVIKAADIAENGAVVPVSVETDLPGTDMIAVFVKDNPSPLAVAFELSDASVAEASTRIKMGKTSDVYAIVRSGGKLYSTSKEVKVTIGGCGG